ncbi:hypothetical protein ILYODFUR_036242 [Ilyodon furcidens]|uniref:Uncharacterized protein n=1 Tax=Ilyodon furcidens TaxID=33524 RepID=A0ABV0U4X6_9TELE
MKHSFICYTASSIVGHGGAGAYLQQSMGERRGTPWTGRQSIAGQHRDIQDKQPSTHSFSSRANLERSVNTHVFGLPAVSRTQDLLVARQQCHHAAPHHPPI